MVFRRVAPEQLSQSILHLRRILKKKTEDEKEVDIEANIAEKQAELAQTKQAAVGRNLILGYINMVNPIELHLLSYICL